MPEVTQIPEGPSQEALAEENAKFDAAREALQTEQNGGIPEDIKGVWDKYQGDPIKLAQAYRGLQQQISKGEAPAPEPEVPATGQERVAKMSEPEQEKVAELVAKLKGDDPQKYAATAKWAAQNIPSDVKEAYNKALAAGDSTLATGLWKGIQYEYLNATGYEPRLVGGRQEGPQDQPFKSKGEMIQAMRDPRYSPQSPKFDRAYHEEVAYKAAMSDHVWAAKA